MDTAYGVKIHATRTMREGERTWSVPAYSYYCGRKYDQQQTTTNRYQATLMTRALADELVVKLTGSGLSATVCDLFADPDALIHSTMIEIGESPAPAAPAPTTLQELGRAIENCFHRDHLSPLEVFTHCAKTILCC